MKLNVIVWSTQRWAVKTKYLTTVYTAPKLRRMTYQTLLNIYIAKSPGPGELYTNRGWLIDAILHVQAKKAVGRAAHLGKRFIDRALA